MMLLNDYQMMNLSDLKYTTEFTESQKELVQKFNTAFYEAQNRPSHQISDHENILDTFDEKYFTNIEKYEDKDSINGNCFFDFITTKNDEPASNITTPASDSTSCFDYNDFCEKFEQQVAENESRKFTQTASYLSQYGIIIENYEHADNENFVFDNALRIRNPSISTETTSTNLSTEYGSLTGDQNSNGECPTYENATYSDSSPFFVPLPFETKTVQNCDTPELENLELSDIDLNESVSNTSLDLDNLEDISYDYENCQFEYTNDCKVKLPPVNTIVKSNMDFTNRLRNIAPENLRIENQEIKYCNAYGHLIGNKNVNNNVSTISLIDEGDLTDTSCPENNQAVMRQNEALLYDDPMLSSSSLILPRRVRKDTEESEMSTDCEDLYSQLQCKWEKCYQIYESQTSLVRHIEKYHVELKRGEEFTCFWLNCPRKNKPFNARYKLLIHMRVHSGEKPNKCPFNGCNKAFSRLENLKIHQRSHTGERPYLCQISNCTKSFSNSSDRAKHQRTHFDTKPYACQVAGCSKKYTDPSSLRKHVKNHTYEEQVELKKRSSEYKPKDNSCLIANKKNENFNKNRYTSTAVSTKNEKTVISTFYTTLDHSYSNNFLHNQYILSANVKQDLKNKISEKISKEKLLVVS